MFVAGYIVPGLPHPLLAPDTAAPWQRIRSAYGKLRAELEASDAEVLLLYSTQWISVIGHQIQADPEPEWVHVDPEWHALGDMPYKFRIDTELAEAYEKAARERGLHARRVAYRGFPIDTGTIVALKLLNPDNRLPACVVSCNMYADRAETLVLGKAAADAVAVQGKRTVAIAVTALSNRLFTEPLDPQQDRISSLKDDEWNRKLLDMLSAGRLEDVSQIARQFTLEANADQKLKAMWWLAAACGQHNQYDGQVHAYEPIWGTGAAVVSLTPSADRVADPEFDEADVDVYQGERRVLDGGLPQSATPDSAPILTERAARPVGAYPHARRVGDLLYLSGVGPRQPNTNAIPGGPVHDAQGQPLTYDVAAQTHAVVENVRQILSAAGSSLDRVIDVTVFLIDMQRDFPIFNRVWEEVFRAIGPTRTTLEVRALPTPIAVEFKVIARA